MEDFGQAVLVPGLVGHEGQLVLGGQFLGFLPGEEADVPVAAQPARAKDRRVELVHAVVQRAEHVNAQHLSHQPVGDVQQGGDRLVVVRPALEQDLLRIFHDDDFHFVRVRAVLLLPELDHVRLRQRIMLPHRQHVEDVRLVEPAHQFRDQRAFAGAGRTIEDGDAARLGLRVLREIAHPRGRVGSVADLQAFLIQRCATC